MNNIFAGDDIEFGKSKKPKLMVKCYVPAYFFNHDLAIPEIAW